MTVIFDRMYQNSSNTADITLANGDWCFEYSFEYFKHCIDESFAEHQLLSKNQPITLCMYNVLEWLVCFESMPLPAELLHVLWPYIRTFIFLTFSFIVFEHSPCISQAIVTKGNRCYNTLHSLLRSVSSIFFLIN
jgi:hypothetical protein